MGSQGGEGGLHQLLGSLATLSSTTQLVSLLLAAGLAWLLRTRMRCFGCRGPLVDTNQGTVEGSTLKTEEGKTIYSYRGLPYAKPPVGKLRFQRPEPADSWPGVRDCRKEASKCLQPNVLSPGAHWLAEGSEDCLTLSVFTKTPPRGEGEQEVLRQELLPVIVFLHGGAFVVGSCEAALYGPDVLLDRGLVLVGVNYRLGPLGWLGLQSEAAPGNLGLWDQRLALLWVRENISTFGGDPANVTLLGESAGSMSAMLHMVAPPSQGLFHRVVALSGTPRNLLLRQSRQPRVYARALAEQLGCAQGASDKEMVEFLQGVEASKIIRHAGMFKDWDYGAPMPWVPASDVGVKEPFLPTSFEEAVRNGSIARVPVIMGCCQDEGLILSSPYHKDPARLELLTKEWDSWAPLLFLGKERQLAGEAEVRLAKEIREHYWPEDDLGQHPEEDLVKLRDIYG